ncbi:unnamed protein product [Diatraea saccharalis]|uniref:Uncharacterized protein n=1 Tax=Diatraea saccharalis TaxID=40085 RepID=A0A9P0C949_9NEOP|nr:unnamed protein product [Diatraea saccharalis]
MVMDLIKKMKSLNYDEHFENNAKNEILECVKRLPMWRPSAIRDRNIFEMQIIDNLINKIHSVNDKEMCKKEIAKWLDNISLWSVDSQGQTVDRNFSKNLMLEKLADLFANGSSKETMKTDIFQILNEFPIKTEGDKTTFIDDLAQMLSNKQQSLVKDGRRDSDYIRNKYEKQIEDWLQDIPGFSKGSSLNVKENRMQVESLIKNLQQLEKQGINTKEIRDEMQSQINDWLERNAGGLDPRTKNKLTDRLLQNLINTSKTASKRATPKYYRNTLVPQILDWLEDISEISGSDSENKKTAENLAIKLEGLTDESDIQNQISNWLSSLSKSKGNRLDAITQNNLIKNLSNKINTRLCTKNDEVLQNNILDVLGEIHVLDIFSNEKKKLAYQLTKSMHEGANEQVIENDIKDWVSNVSKSIGTQLTPKDEENLTNKLLSLTKTYPKQRRRWSDQEHMKNNINQQISQIFENSGVSLDNDSKKKIQNKILDCIADKNQYFDSDDVFMKIVDILEEDADLPTREAKKIANDIINKSKYVNISRRISISQETDTSNILADQEMRGYPYPVPNETQICKSPIKKQIFIDSALNEILDFTAELTGDNSLRSTKEWKEAAVELAERVSDILFDSNSTPAYKRDLLNEEVLRYFQNLHIETDETQNDQVRKHVDRLQNLAYTTSTPRTSFIEKTHSFFHPHQKSQNFSLSTINENASLSQYKKPPTAEEKQYMSQLEHKIEDWLETLPINFGASNDNDFKKTMLKDLASDILDRQKYLQLNPMTKTSDEEELEHLKYQVFRWLNKLPDIKELMPSIAKTDELMEFMKSVPVPCLVQNKNPYESNQNSNFSSIHDEISNWIEAVPSHVFKLKDKNHQKEMIKELANEIGEYQMNCTLTETALDDLILRWLQKNLNCRKQSLENKSETLKSALLNKDIVSFVRDDQEENFQAAIGEWFKSLPLKSRTSTDIKQIENVKENLMKSLKKIHQQDSPSSANYDKKIKEEIEKHLQLLPVSSIEQKNIALVQQKVTELLGNLKQIRTETESKRPSLSNTALKSVIDDWSSNLPFKPGKSSNDIKKDVDEFMSTIKSMFKNNDVNSFNVELQNQVEKLLKKIPLQMNLVNEEHKQRLMNKLLELMRSNTNVSFGKTTDILYDDIEDWFNNLPISNGNTPNEIEKHETLKRNIVSKLLQKIKDLNMKPDIFNDNTLYEDLLNDEIDDLLSTLPQTPQLLDQKESIKDNITKKVKQAKQKTESELAGYAYKQQLRDAISTTLPQIGNVATEEKAPFEILKETVADAFIKLHYTPNNELKNKYKQEIGKAIDQFCNDYLKLFPASPVDPKKLNHELHTALQKVPKPKDDTVKSQVEQVRIKEQIDEWLNDLLLEDTSHTQQLQKNKIVSILANVLHETEKEKDVNPNFNFENKMRQDIMMWMKKLSLKPETKKNIDEHIDKLIKKLNCTEDSRKFSISNLDHTVNAVKSQYQYHIPPSTLSKEDRNHLERIRQRSQRSPCGVCPPTLLSKDAYVNPIPMDASNQTDVFQQRQPLSPNININEYNWESVDDVSRLWESSNEPYQQNRMDHLSRNYYDAGQQQQPAQYILPQEQNNTWSRSSAQRNSNVSPRNAYESLKPSVPMSAPCTSQFQQPCVTPKAPCSEPQPCSSSPPCTYLEPSCVLKTNSNNAVPYYDNIQPPYNPQFNNTIPQPQPCTTLHPPCIPQPSCAPLPCIPQHATGAPDLSTPHLRSFPSQAPPCLSQNMTPEFKQRRYPKKPQIFNIPPCMKTCGNQSLGPKTSKGSPVDESLYNNEIDDIVWGLPCVRRSKRVPLSSIDIIKCRNDEKSKYHCREHYTPRICDQRPCMTKDLMQRCPKCCGVHCPYPSYLFFR